MAAELDAGELEGIIAADLRELTKRINVSAGRLLSDYRKHTNTCFSESMLGEERARNMVELGGFIVRGVKCDPQFIMGRRGGVICRVEIEVPDAFFADVRTKADEKTQMRLLANLATRIVLARGKVFLIDQRLEKLRTPT